MNSEFHSNPDDFVQANQTSHSVSKNDDYDYHSMVIKRMCTQIIIRLLDTKNNQAKEQKELAKILKVSKDFAHTTLNKFNISHSRGNKRNVRFSGTLG